MIFISYLSENFDKIFKKYSDEELINDINNFKNKNGRLYKTLNHFFEECMFKCCGKRTKISPYDVLQSDELMEKVISYINGKPNFFKSQDEIFNVKQSFRNSFSWVRKVGNFPAREAARIYNKYFDKEKLNCLDTSCGFGSRMSGALLTGNNYYGFEPNNELFKKLNEYGDFLRKNNIITGQDFRIYCTGSENFVEDLVNKIDVAFTSPPYFDLEKYSDDGGESTNNYDNYDKWIECFAKKTIINTYKYLKVGGYAMINIKNISKKYMLYDDFFDIFINIDGMEYVETFFLEINKKQYGMKFKNERGMIDNTEPIMVFKKIK